MIKTIHAAIAAPGAGKTQALITQLPNLIQQGEMFVIAFPTLNLCDDVIAEMHKHGLNPKVINSKSSETKSVAKIIEGILRNGNENLIIVTHEGLRLTDPKLMRGYTLVIDEVPNVFEFQHILNLRKAEADKLFIELESIGGLLQIKMGRMTAVKERVRTYKAATQDNLLTSTLSKAEFQIFKTLTSKGIVHFEEAVRAGQPSYNFFAIENKSIFKHIVKAKETHILAANISGGIFDCFAKLQGYQIKESKFTPNYFEYNCPITIYPMLDVPWSKGKVLTDNSGKQHDKHLGESESQVIDQIFSSAIQNTPNEKFLVVQNRWGKFDQSYAKKGLDIEFPSLDCRGLNTLKDRTAAILLFSGQPSPNDKKSLRILAKKYDIDMNTLEKAWVVNNKLEASLQAATRTAVRDRENREHVHLYVQDAEVAEYLAHRYMKNAKIDKRLALTPPQKKDGRSNLTPNQTEEMYKFIDHAYRQGMKRRIINKQITERWPMSPGNARKKTQYLTKENNSSAEDLSRFLD